MPFKQVALRSFINIFTAITFNGFYTNFDNFSINGGVDQGEAYTYVRVGLCAMYSCYILDSNGVIHSFLYFMSLNKVESTCQMCILQIVPPFSILISPFGHLISLQPINKTVPPK